jgi:hypothetical protein
MQFDSVCIVMTTALLTLLLLHFCCCCLLHIHTCTNKQAQVELCIEFMEGYPNLNNIAGGQYDWKLKQFAAAAQRDGRRISVRFLHGTFLYTGCASLMRCSSLNGFVSCSTLDPSKQLILIIHCSCVCCVAFSGTDTAPPQSSTVTGE